VGSGTRPTQTKFKKKKKKIPLPGKTVCNISVKKCNIFIFSLKLGRKSEECNYFCNWPSFHENQLGSFKFSGKIFGQLATLRGLFPF